MRPRPAKPPSRAASFNFKLQSTFADLKLSPTVLSPKTKYSMPTSPQGRSPHALSPGTLERRVDTEATINFERPAESFTDPRHIKRPKKKLQLPAEAEGSFLFDSKAERILFVWKD